MAKVPAPEEISSLILDIARDMNVRAGEIAPLMGIQQRLGSSYRASDINAALAYMADNGLIEEARPGFIKLTQAGYGPEPTSEEIARALLDVIGGYNIRPGEAVPGHGVAPKLMMQGYSGDEITDAFGALATGGLLEVRNGTHFLTEKGFEAI